MKCKTDINSTQNEVGGNHDYRVHHRPRRKCSSKHSLTESRLLTAKIEDSESDKSVYCEMNRNCDDTVKVVIMITTSRSTAGEE
jgi:hypothetical protein